MCTYIFLFGRNRKINVVLRKVLTYFKGIFNDEFANDLSCGVFISKIIFY